MNKLLLLIAVAIASTTLAYSLEPISVVVNFGSGDDISVSVTNGSGPALYTEDIDELTPNSSGLLVFAVGVGESDWADIDEASITTSHVLNVLDGQTIVAQFRLDYLIDVSARSGLLGTNMKVRGNFSMNSEEFTTADNLGDILSANIMVYTGASDLTIDEDDLFEGLPANTLYYIVNNSSDVNSVLTFSTEDHFPEISHDEFIILLRLDNGFYILNHEVEEFPFGQD